MSSEPPRPRTPSPHSTTDDRSRGPSAERAPSRPRWLALVSPSLVLENTGSVARDHLASERTWLAYVRTSLAIASTGVALVQLFTISSGSSGSGRLNVRLQRFARPLGAATIALGIAVLLIGILRYFRVQHALVRGKFPAAQRTVSVVSVALGALVIAVFAVLVSVSRIQH